MVCHCSTVRGLLQHRWAPLGARTHMLAAAACYSPAWSGPREFAHSTKFNLMLEEDARVAQTPAAAAAAGGAVGLPPLLTADQ